ncbi:uncharacterized protein LDX57_009983 [Aspergillus melleus]|uniref:uncharacterized protein n=1 Tax=Aspergillus melleus TaxID=138277 RepID=UPI001E8E7352|nr:uncharacterized protein LDX57_009983 [Aspergillus melleus]KAH8432345.1 hypothetical protein LDX57_009983 [Aspergillus melleus]
MSTDENFQCPLSQSMAYWDDLESLGVAATPVVDRGATNEKAGFPSAFLLHIAIRLDGRILRQNEPEPGKTTLETEPGQSPHRPGRCNRVRQTQRLSDPSG